MLWLVGVATILGLLWWVFGRSPSNAPPSAWLSLLPPIVEYGKDPASFLVRARAKYGDVFRVPGPNLSMTFMFGQANLRAFYEAPETDLSIMHGISRVVGHILGPRLLSPPPGMPELAFQSFLKNLHQASALAVYRPGFEDVMRQWVDRLASLPSFDLFKEMSTLIVRLSLRLALGAPGLAALGEVVGQQWRELEEASFQTLTLMAPWLPFGAPAKFQRLRQPVWAALDRVIDSLADNPPEDSYMALMLRDKSVDLQGKYREDLKVHLKSMLYAGHINTSGTLSWLLARLTEHPEAERRAREEQAQTVAAVGTELSMDTFAKMPFLDSCFRETLRDLAIISNMRMVMKPFTTASGVVVPAGHLIMVSPKLLETDPAVWHAPGTWDPDRFDTVQRQQQLRSSLTYVPFGHGTHLCKGERIATFVIKWFVCALLRGFKIHRLSPAGPLQPDYTQPTAGLPVPSTPLIVRLEPLSAPLGLPNDAAVQRS